MLCNNSYNIENQKKLIKINFEQTRTEYYDFVKNLTEIKSILFGPDNESVKWSLK